MQARTCGLLCNTWHMPLLTASQSLFPPLLFPKSVQSALHIIFAWAWWGRHAFSECLLIWLQWIPPLFILKRKSIVKSSNIQQLLIEHGREHHSSKAIAGGNPIESSIRSKSDRRRRMEEVESEVRCDMESMGDKMKAGSNAIGSKMKDPDRDLKRVSEKEKREEKNRK